MYVVTPSEAKAIDQRAIDEFSIPGIVLMENAALKTVDIIRKKYIKDCCSGKVVVLVGGGNNGGDGMAIARHLMLGGIELEVFIFSPEDRITGDAKTNLDILKKLQAAIRWVEDRNDLSLLDRELKGACLVIDSLFGTGLCRDIEGIVYEAIEKVNSHNVPVVAVDIPSGIHGENGHVMGIAIKADDTVTFGYPKRGHILFPGREYTGELHVVPISLPSDSAEAEGVSGFTLGDMEVAMGLKERPSDGHKGTFGHVAVIAGSTGMTGAACLTSMAALRTGAGLVTLGVPASLNPIFENKLTEVMTVPLEDKGTGYLLSSGMEEIKKLITGKDVLAIGPGWGKNCDGLEILRNILAEFSIPIVIDADALNHISQDMELLSKHRGPVIITPHPGEMARLTIKSIKEVVEHPVDTAQKLARDYDIIVLLKGATSVVAHPDGRIYFNRSGNSGMGTGGSGDVLTGVIASFIAQGYSPYDAAVFGCYIHGRAGDYAKDRLGEAGMVAGDILDALPLVLKDLHDLKKLK